jgi:hypothetical protein
MGGSYVPTFYASMDTATLLAPSRLRWPVRLPYATPKQIEYFKELTKRPAPAPAFIKGRLLTGREMLFIDLVHQFFQLLLRLHIDNCKPVYRFCK